MLPLPAETARDRITIGKDGLIRVRAKMPDTRFENPWPEAFETEYCKRADKHIRAFKGKALVNTSGENEKGTYPEAMLAFLAGDCKPALEGLQLEDTQAGTDHAHTLGIDLYWSFTLKGQVLKYFYFGNDLAPNYKKRMFDAGKIWTREDPRPSIEYFLLLDSKDPQVADYALAQLKRMWRSPEQVRQMATKAIKEGHPNKEAFGQFMVRFAGGLKDEDYGKDVAKWRAWAKGITDGGWMIFEEYERRTNPNPHPKYGIGTGPVGATWPPSVRGTQADPRNTDNLRAMREVAACLFAEETGNETIRRLYKEKIRRTAFGFWSVGNGEWDSEGYLAHALSSYSNLYSFAKDTEVRGWAKAILDFLYLSAATKYWRGCWGSPLVRDYGNVAPWSGSANLCHLHFGDAPSGPPKPALDQVFLICSGYRPPAATIALARKQFAKPFEMLNSHPHYENWLPGKSNAPAYHETMYYAHSYQYGTLPQGHGYNRNGFKILLWNSQTGADYFVPTTGKFKHTTASTAGGDQIAQFRNLAIYLNGKAWKGKRGTTPYNFVLPKRIKHEDVNGIRFLRFERTWMALAPVNLAFKEFGPLKSKFNKGDVLHLMTAAGIGGPVCGFAMELGEQETHGTYEDFKAAVLKSSKLDLSDAGGGTVGYTGSKGTSVRLAWSGKGLPRVWRNGKLHDWKSHFALYQSADEQSAPATLGWKERKMHVEAGGHTFDATLHEDGRYEFSAKLAPSD